MAKITTSVAHSIIDKHFIITNNDGLSIARYVEPLHKCRMFGDNVLELRRVDTIPHVSDSVNEPLVLWSNSEKGQWILKNGRKTIFTVFSDPTMYQFQIVIATYLLPKKWTEFALRFSC